MELASVTISALWGWADSPPTPTSDAQGHSLVGHLVAREQLDTFLHISFLTALGSTHRTLLQASRNKDERDHRNGRKERHSPLQILERKTETCLSILTLL